MLNDLIGFFTGSPQNRRQYPRRSGPFKAWMAQGSSWTSVVCVDISGSGIGIVSRTPAAAEANFRLMVENRPILVRAKRIWQRPGTRQGKPAWRYGFTFTGISADDWDAVVRFCNNDEVVVENKLQKELDLVKMQADDVARLIPKKLQDQLLGILVERRRLAPLDDDRNPLVQFMYGGVIKRGNTVLHRLVIHSRLRDSVTGEITSFDTRFFFDDHGNNVTVDE